MSLGFSAQSFAETTVTLSYTSTIVQLAHFTSGKRWYSHTTATRGLSRTGSECIGWVQDHPDYKPDWGMVIDMVGDASLTINQEKS